MRRSLLSLLLTLIFFGVTSAQKKTVAVSGVVISSEDNTPIIGASVLAVEYPRQGALTDAQGHFRLQLPEDAKTLRISYLGYLTKTVALTGKELRILLESSEKSLDPVVVAAYGTQRKSSLTGATASVKGSDLANAKVESVDKALAGKVSGIRVASQTGDPGAAGTIQIRGVGSINGSTDPLYVVDGLPITVGNYGIPGTSSNTLSSINPEDIETITVLKDAASASLYGSRAANGVVVITTKQGKQGKTRFNFKSSLGFSQVATNSYEVMNAAERYAYQREAYINRYLYSKDAILPTGKGYAQRDALRQQAEAIYTDSYFLNTPRKDDNNIFVRDAVTRSDWRKELFRSGALQDVSFSASGGTDALRYFASLGYNNVKSITPFGKFTRYSGLLNVDDKATKWLDLSFKGQVAYTSQLGIGDHARQRPGVTLGHPAVLLLISRPDRPVKDEQGNYTTDATNMKGSDNPVQLLDPDLISNELGTLRGVGNVSATIKFTDFLNFKTTNSIEYTGLKIRQYQSPNTNDGGRVGGQGARGLNELVSKTTSNVLNFNKDFGPHHFDALAGIEAQSYQQLSYTFVTQKYATDKLKELGVAQVVESESQTFGSFLLSYLGRLNYSYDSRYLLGLSLRNDISSKLGQNKRSGIFYSVSGAWRFGKEEFLKDNAILTDAKLRASYGTNGNLPDGEYTWRGLYSYAGTYGEDPAIYLSQLANLNLGWEKSKSFNIGLDLTFARRFTLTLEYFNKHTSDLLLDTPVSFNYSVKSKQTNNGEISNQGLELELQANNLLNSSSLRWDANFSLTKIRSRVEALPGGDVFTGPNDIYLYRPGYDIHTFYLRSWAGVNPQTGLGQFLIDPSKPATEDNLTYDYSKARTAPGKSAYPKVYGGLSNTFSYRGFTLSALLTYQFGGYLLDQFDVFAINDGQRPSMNASRLLVGDYWTPSNTSANNPRPILGNPYRSGTISTRNLHSSDFIRLKELSLSYALPKSLTSRLGVSSTSVSVTANNLAFLYAATKNRELEVALNGFRSLDIPALRTVSFGLNVGF